MKNNDMKNNNDRLYVDVHAIQNIPPANANRDENGNPKTVRFGGVERGRISSQSWKRAIREYFMENYDIEKLGTRTLEVINLIVDKVQEIEGKSDDDFATERKNVQDQVTATLNSIGIKTGKSKHDDKHPILSSMFFIGNKQAHNIAQGIVDGRGESILKWQKAAQKDKSKYSDDKKKDTTFFKQQMTDDVSIDLALFGRMVANVHPLQVDASSQVAHSISTHAVQNEDDFFSAVDEYSPDDSGSGMLGDIFFNASTHYRYANVAAHELKKQLNGDTEKTINTIKLFLKAFVKAMPSGHITSFANQTVPDALVVTVRNDRPVSLASGFETPIRDREHNGYTDKSIQRLQDTFDKTSRFVNPYEFSLTIGIPQSKDKDGSIGEEQRDLNTLLDNFGKRIKKCFEDKKD